MKAQTLALLAAVTGLVAIFAYAGALGLITGVVNLDHAVLARLPFHSPQLAGAALALIVAVPMTVVARLAVKDDERTAWAAVAGGGLLIAWVVLALTVARDYSWLQGLFAVAGFGVLLVGLRYVHPKVRR